MKKLEDYVTTIPDFPEKGIMFRDITSVLQDADGLRLAVDTMQDPVEHPYYMVVNMADNIDYHFYALPKNNNIVNH